MDFTIFFTVILSDLIKLSLSFTKTKTCGKKICIHVDIDAYCFERALQEQKFKLTAAFIALIML